LSRGLAIIKGRVKNFKNNSEIKTVPHVGWNQIEINLDNTSNLINPLKNINNGDFFYFIHSFYVDPENKECIKSNTTLDGFTFCSSIIHENIFASQFHPEKSGKKGLQILQNFFS
jgi:imidazole glycerol-phosphate synthase subunit HisH